MVRRVTVDAYDARVCVSSTRRSTGGTTPCLRGVIGRGGDDCALRVPHQNCNLIGLFPLRAVGAVLESARRTEDGKQPIDSFERNAADKANY